MQLSRLVAIGWVVLAAAGCHRSGDPLPGSTVPAAQPPASPFLVKPYLQWGDSPNWRSGSGIQVLWHDDDVEAAWSVEYRPESAEWQTAEMPNVRRIAVRGLAPHRLYRVSLKRLTPGAEFRYRVRKDGEVVFSASGHAPAASGDPYRFVVFGDCGANTREQRAVAYQAYQAHPDFVLLTGDIVYDRGLISEYRTKFWPIYNADGVSRVNGVPLLRSTIFLAAPGNHDIGPHDLGAYPDGLAYFLYWAQPLNGPSGAEGGPLVPVLKGPASDRQAFFDAAGPAFPQMANFSFDYGNAHWLILDANRYVDWTDPGLRAWIQNDLKAARRAAWHFVGLHQPGFQSAKKHAAEQNMRLLADVFEAEHVDIVFCGHVHNYQRTWPIHFICDRGPGGKPVRQKELVPGRWVLDKAFDGQLNTCPNGVIYVVSGGGGASLYNQEQEDDPASWQEFTRKFVSKVHSLTVAEVNGSSLIVRQLSLDGQELDRFVINK